MALSETPPKRIQNRMQFRRIRSARRRDWSLAIVFNGLMILIPVLAARVLAAAFAGEGLAGEPTMDALSETRRLMDRSFAALPPRGADQRAFWADLVERELTEKDMSAARGFLLAAPAMLNGDDARALRAAAEAEPSGSEDQRLARAALLFLPNPARARYEAAIRPPQIQLAMAPPPADETDLEADADAGAVQAAGETVDHGGDVVSDAAAVDLFDINTPPSAFSILGDLDDLAAHSRSWIRGGDEDPFVLRLTGFALIADALDSADTAEIGAPAQAASIIKATHRASRLSPQFDRMLQQRFDAALPEETLRRALETAFDGAPLPQDHGPRVRQAYLDSVDPRMLPRLLRDVRLINRLADETAPAGAMTLLSEVRDQTDLFRARLIVEAGGDRAVALVKQTGREALSAAETGIIWTRPLLTEVLTLAAAAMALIWLVVIAASRAMDMSRVRAIAI